MDWITDKFVVANKGDLAVLHNRNKMVNAFANTEWVSGSGRTIISRSVTSCAGMTACRVFWLELDDKALLDSYAVLHEGILYDVFSQKCSAA